MCKISLRCSRTFLTSNCNIVNKTPPPRRERVQRHLFLCCNIKSLPLSDPKSLRPPTLGCTSRDQDLPLDLVIKPLTGGKVDPGRPKKVPVPISQWRKPAREENDFRRTTLPGQTRGLTMTKFLSSQVLGLIITEILLV